MLIKKGFCSATRVLRLATVGLLLGFGTSCFYQKMDPAPDLDKGPPPPPPPDVDNSCWLATASNMLAEAGYGTGTTVQQRADEIYAEMVAHYTKADRGWTDTALRWWLNSTNNTWPANPYTVVTVYGNKIPKHPWANLNGAQDIANGLRRCCPVGLSISWPTNAPGEVGSGGHAITALGDNNRDSDELSSNPSSVRVTDSDDDTGGDVQSYRYDAYTNPNPGGANEGNGWYIDYDPNHPYIKHIVTLCPTDDPTDNKLTQKVIGSYKIHQGLETRATDLHYQVGTDVTILTYRTTIDWLIGSATIVEADPRTEITVDWDLSANPVPDSTWVTITTEFVLPTWNAIEYDDVHFTYPAGIEAVKLPSLGWKLESPPIERADTIPNVTGGYVVGSFGIVDPQLPPGSSPVGEYRFVHEYSYTQSPETHALRITGTTGYEVTDVRVGHVYGYLDAETLWAFEDWMTELPDQQYRLGADPIEIDIDWSGRLPYPEGEDIRGRIPGRERGLLREPAQ